MNEQEDGSPNGSEDDGGEAELGFVDHVRHEECPHRRAAHNADRYRPPALAKVVRMTNEERGEDEGQYETDRADGVHPQRRSARAEVECEQRARDGDRNSETNRDG